MSGFEITQEFLRKLARLIEGVSVRNPSRADDRMAAVLLLLTTSSNGLAFVGIIRSSHGTHGGQFALPGGRREVAETLFECALREAREEVGLAVPVESLGDLGEFNTVASGFRVQVEVAFAPSLGVLRRDPREVEGLLVVPFQELIEAHDRLPFVADVWELPLTMGYEFDAGPHLRDGRLPPRGLGHRIVSGDGSVLEMPFVWGLTARILYVFLQSVVIPAQQSDGR